VRDSRVRRFEVGKEIDVDRVLSLDVAQLREALVKGEFTSVDLVGVFAERC